MTGPPRLEPTTRAELRPQVRTSTIVSATLLALPAPMLRDAVLTEAERNPALIVRERPTCLTCGRRLAGGCPGCRSTARYDTEPVASVSMGEQLRRDALASAPRRLANVITSVLAALDEHGLLTAVARAQLLDTGTPAAELDRALDVVRETGPPGIAAATPAESLLAQLDHAPLRPAEHAMARRLLTVHAGLLEDGDLSRIASIEGCEPDDVRTLLTRLGRLLRPYPRLDDAAPGPPPRPPDLIFEAHGATVLAVVVEAQGLVLDLDPDCPIQTAVRDAHALIGRVRRRWSMLQRIGDLLAVHHAATLLARSTAFRPLTQAQAADRLRVHESTISRAVAHREARLVGGRRIELRAMFGAHNDARAAVAELCAETPRPSDRRVAELLAVRGIVVSRRAVAKYRLAMGRPVG